MRDRAIGWVLTMCVLVGAAFADDYYVSPGGSDSNPGSEARPFRTIQRAADVVEPGDTCYVRGGIYHEAVMVSEVQGTEDGPVLFTPYPGQRVTLDGTVPIEADWTRYEGGIYRAKIEKDVWQLFVDGEMMTAARWPNGSLQDGSLWDQPSSWSHQSSDSTYGHVVDDAEYNDLAATGVDFTGAVAVLNIGSFRSIVSRVIRHGAGSDEFTYRKTRSEKIWRKARQGWYFLQGKLACLDAPGEWFYDRSSGYLYLWPLDGKNPAGREVRGKTLTYALTAENCAHVEFRGFDFFASGFALRGCRRSTVADSHLRFPSYSKRMLGELSQPQVCMLGARNGDETANAVRNCVIEYSEGPALRIQGTGDVVENCYFHHIDFNCSGSGYGVDGSRSEGTIFRRNTVHTAGSSEGYKSGHRNLITLNRIYDCGYLQSDGAQYQISAYVHQGTEVSYNWCHDAPVANPFCNIKHGIRLDGSFVGAMLGKRADPRGALLHHNVVWACQMMTIKGDEQRVFHNLCFDNENTDLWIRSLTGQPVPKGILEGYEYGGLGPGADHPLENDKSVIRNNMGGQLSSHRRRPSLGLPGRNSNNWQGEVAEQLRDPAHLDFRPQRKSAVVDAGYYVKGVNDGYAGKAPDVGAYEYGSESYWIPGRKAPQASTPIPPDGVDGIPQDADLMWLEGYRAEASDVYFGADREAVKGADRDSGVYRGRQESNIFEPGELQPGQAYYWRVDAVQGDGVEKGGVWSFTVASD